MIRAGLIIATIAAALPAIVQASVALIPGVLAPQATLDFSGADLGSSSATYFYDGEPITDQYAPEGVTFSGALAVDEGTADTYFFPGPPYGVASNFAYGGDFLGLVFTATFASPVYQIGFFEELNPEDFVSVALYRSGVQVGAIGLPGDEDLDDDGAAAVAFGSSRAFDEAVFTVADNFNGFFAMNDFAFGVPEPAGWALMLVGAGLCGSALRGRRASPTIVARRA